MGRIVRFTIGRGSAFGCKPSIEIAIDSAMSRRLEDDRDVHCRIILAGEETVEQAGERIFARILRFAGGERTKSEPFEFGASEVAPWQLGATV